MRAGHCLVAAALVALAVLSPAVAKHGTTETREYVGPAPVFGSRIYGDWDPPNGGYARFPVGDAETVTLSIDDATGLETSGMVVIDTPPDDPDPVGSVEAVVQADDENGVVFRDFFCGSTGTLSIPSEADHVHVFVGPIDGILLAPHYGETDPPVCPGPGTVGEVEADWG